MTRVENRKEVWVGSKTGRRFDSGRKQERGLGRVENGSEVSVASKFGSGRKQEGGLGRIENRREVVLLYLCPLIVDISSDVM